MERKNNALMLGGSGGWGPEEWLHVKLKQLAFPV